MKSQQIQWIYTAVLGLVEQWVSTGAEVRLELIGYLAGAMGIYWSNGYLLEQPSTGAMGFYWSNGYLLEQQATCLQGKHTLHYSQLTRTYITQTL